MNVHLFLYVTAADVKIHLKVLRDLYMRKTKPEAKKSGSGYEHLPVRTPHIIDRLKFLEPYRRIGRPTQSTPYSPSLDCPPLPDAVKSLPLWLAGKGPELFCWSWFPAYQKRTTSENLAGSRRADSATECRLAQNQQKTARRKHNNIIF